MSETTMTRDKILALPAGPRLDALVAAAARGVSIRRRRRTFWRQGRWVEEDGFLEVRPVPEGGHVTAPVAPASTHLAAAFDAAEALAGKGCRLVLDDRRDQAAPGWAALFDLPDGHDTGVAVAATPAHAVALACLLASRALGLAPGALGEVCL